MAAFGIQNIANTEEITATACIKPVAATHMVSSNIEAECLEAAVPTWL